MLDVKTHNVGATIQNAKDGLLLGIIQNGMVRVESFSTGGHVEWLARLGMNKEEVDFGFSVRVSKGRVRWIFRRSDLNRRVFPDDDPALPEQFTLELMRVLPCVANVQAVPPV